MPPPETFCRHQKAVLWARTGTDDYGQPIVAAPVEIDVRWDGPTRREVLDAQGNTIAIDAEVSCIQTIKVGSVMWLGKLTDWYGTGSAGTEVGLMEVKLYREVPDIKGREIRRTVSLMRLNDTLPD